MEKQLLIIDDLLVSDKDFQDLYDNSDLPYKICRDETEVKPDQVEILITVVKAVDRDFIRKFPHLKMIAVAFTGYDHVDTEYCKEQGIAVYNVPKYSTDSVAELAVGLSLALLREIPQSGTQMRNGHWNVVPGRELSGQTVGIIGTGTIGLAAVRLFKAFGCKLLGWSRTERQEFIDLGGKYTADLKNLFAQADIVSIHLPLNKNTVGIIGKEELSAMKPTAFLVNTARSPIIDEKALIEVLKAGKIAGAGLDVFEKEPVSIENPLLHMDNVIVTPHIAYKTEEAVSRRAQVTLDNIRDFLDGKKGNRVA